MNVAGVDACPQGWFLVALDAAEHWECAIYETVIKFHEPRKLNGAPEIAATSTGLRMTCQF